MNTTPYVTTGSISASPDDLIQTKSLSIAQSTNKLDTSMNIYDEYKSFETPRKKSQCHWTKW